MAVSEALRPMSRLGFGGVTAAARVSSSAAVAAAVLKASRNVGQLLDLRREYGPLLALPFVSQL
jgi:hypothetical protein